MSTTSLASCSVTCSLSSTFARACAPESEQTNEYSSERREREKQIKSPNPKSPKPERMTSKSFDQCVHPIVGRQKSRPKQHETRNSTHAPCRALAPQICNKPWAELAAERTQITARRRASRPRNPPSEEKKKAMNIGRHTKSVSVDQRGAKTQPQHVSGTRDTTALWKRPKWLRQPPWRGSRACAR